LPAIAYHLPFARRPLQSRAVSLHYVPPNKEITMFQALRTLHSGALAPVFCGFQGNFGIDGKLLAPGICWVRPPDALPVAHDPMMSVACCIAYAFSMSVALGSVRCVVPANDEAAVESTAGSLRADGPAAAGLGNLLAIAEHSALLAADC